MVFIKELNVSAKKKEKQFSWIKELFSPHYSSVAWDFQKPTAGAEMVGKQLQIQIAMALMLIKHTHTHTHMRAAQAIRRIWNSQRIQVFRGFPFSDLGQ